MLGGSVSDILGSLWYNSSVMNGMKGDSRRSPTCKHLYNTDFAVAMAVVSLLWKTGFKYSKYTSQIS